MIAIFARSFTGFLPGRHAGWGRLGPWAKGLSGGVVPALVTTSTQPAEASGKRDKFAWAEAAAGPDEERLSAF